MVDLHIHSYYSDGVYSPKELTQKAKNLGIDTLALTDHNCIDGLDDFFSTANEFGLNAIPGIEIYTHYKDKQLHILGYDFDIHDKDLNKALKKLQKKHILQIRTTVKILQQDGWNIDEKKVFNTKAAYIGSSNIAGVLKKDPQNWERIKKDFNPPLPKLRRAKKIIPITEIIAKYFFKDKQIYFESEITASKAINLLKNAGGKVVLAHPGQQLSWKDEDIIVELKNLGLDGIEAITPHHSWQEIEHWQIIARELDLTITAGSDFHGYVPKEWNFVVRGPWGYFYPQAEV